jgi:hypothetical protein
MMWQELDDGNPEGLILTQLERGVLWPCKQKHLDHFVADEETGLSLQPGSAHSVDIVHGGVASDAPSDHCPIVVTLDFDRPVEEMLAERQAERKRIAASAPVAARPWE